MGYEELEVQGRISSSLCHAIETEQEISDLLFDGYTCDSPQIRRCYEQAREISGDLDGFGKLVVGGVGKKLWRERVNSFADPTAHPEYSPNMDHEIDEYFHNIQAIQNEGLRQIAHQVIASVNLPPPLKQVAA